MRSPTLVLATLAGVAALGLAAACGAPAPAAPPPPTVAPTVSSGMDEMPGMPGMDDGGVALYAVQTGTLGIVAADGAGHLLYGSHGDANAPSASRCTGTCAQEWQPVVVAKGEQPQLLGVAATTVGTLARPDGSSQVTIDGWPVYVNRADDGQLTAAVPDAHGMWFAFTPQGRPIAL